MADEYNKTSDEVVDEIPEDAKSISENARSSQTSSNNYRNSSDSSLTGIISLVLGIFSIICCCTVMPAAISAVIGLILGIISFKDKSNNIKTFATLGIILCSIGIAIFLFAMASFIIYSSINATFEIPAAMHQMTM